MGDLRKHGAFDWLSLYLLGIRAAPKGAARGLRVRGRDHGTIVSPRIKPVQTPCIGSSNASRRPTMIRCLSPSLVAAKNLSLRRELQLPPVRRLHPGAEYRRVALLLSNHGPTDGPLPACTQVRH